MVVSPIEEEMFRVAYPFHEDIDGRVRRRLVLADVRG